jgi:hypothetical protein
MPNPFAKTRPANSPYAIYRAGDYTMHVCKTYKQPSSEVKDPYARWFVWAKSPATCGSFEGGDTYRREVVGFFVMVAATPQWQEAYGTRLLPTPEEYLANT